MHRKKRKKVNHDEECFGLAAYIKSPVLNFFATFVSRYFYKCFVYVNGKWKQRQETLYFGTAMCIWPNI